MTWWQHLEVDREEDLPLYRQLFVQLRNCIEKEKVKPNSKLPPIRDLAEEVGVNPATIVRAYEELEEKKYIYKKVGSGSFVAPEDSYKPAIREEGEESSLEMLGFGQLDLKGDINFASATPAASLFPVEDFKKAIDHVLERDRGEAFTYQRSQGFYPLRESIQDNFARRGLNIPLDEIQIVSGAQQAIDLIVKIMLDYGDRVITEDPTYPGAISAFSSRAASIDRVELKEDGMDLNKLESRLSSENYRMIYVMTSFQNPTGICWSEEKKRDLVELAGKYDVNIIEDDCLSELYYSGEPPRPLKSFDREGRVFYIKSFSKVFMPGLRLAFLTLPEKYQSRLLAAKHATDISSAGLTQRAMDFYLREELWDQHIERMRDLFGSRFNIMLELIESELQPEVKLICRPRGGIYFWLKLSNALKGEELYQQSRQRGVAMLPGAVFSEGGKYKDYFRLSFAAVREEEIEEGIVRLAETVSGRELGERQEDDGYLPLV